MIDVGDRCLSCRSRDSISSNVGTVFSADDVTTYSVHLSKLGYVLGTNSQHDVSVRNRRSLQSVLEEQES